MVGASGDAGELGRAAPDVDERAPLDSPVARGAHESEVGFVFCGQKRDGKTAALFDGAHGGRRVLAVAQHGGGEHVGSFAVEILEAFGVACEHVECVVDALIGERAVRNVGREARHHFVVEQRSEIFAGVGALRVVLVDA